MNEKGAKLIRMAKMIQRFAAEETKLVLTQEEYEDKLKQLKELQRERKRLAEVIHEAAQLGDLSENFEYQSAKQELRMVEARYIELEHQLSQARVLSQKEINLVARKKIVTPFSTFYLDVNGRRGWYAFRKGDVKPRARIITVNSPLGKAVLGQKAGEFVDYEVGSREFEVEILKVLPYSKALM